MIACAIPRCSDCARPVHVCERFVGGVSQQLRCAGCGVTLRVQSVVGGWTVATAAEHAGQRSAPLPAVASPALRSRFLSACRGVARLLQPCEGVEPGMAAVVEERP